MYRYKSGFTIIELMVTLVVAAIVLAIAIPSFTLQIRNNQALGLGEELVSAINYARSEAVKRGARVSMCASSNGTQCVGSWSDGWIVFVDSAATDTTKPPVIAPNPGVLRYWGDVPTTANVTASDSKTFIRYTGMGTLARVDNDNAVVLTAKISGCTRGRTITVGLSGSVGLAPTDC